MKIGDRFTLNDTLSLFFTALFVLTAVISVTRAAPKMGPFGLWLTQAGDAKVLVSRCSAGICGKVVWLREPLDNVTGRPQTDDKNPDPSQRKRPIVGLPIFIGMQPSTPNAWSGRIYNADNGQSYASTITQLDAERLEVRGCAGPLCGSEIWTRTTR